MLNVFTALRTIAHVDFSKEKGKPLIGFLVSDEDGAIEFVNTQGERYRLVKKEKGAKVLLESADNTSDPDVIKSFALYT